MIVIARQDDTVNNVILAVQSVLDRFFEHLKKARRFQVLDYSVSPTVTIIHKYRLGEEIVQNIADFSLNAVIRLETDKGVLMTCKMHKYEYRADDFVLDEPIDPYRVRNWRGCDVISGFIADVMQEVVDYYIKAIWTRRTPMEETVWDHEGLGEFLQLSHEFVETLSVWSHHGNASMGDFVHRMTYLMDNALDIDRENHTKNLTLCLINIMRTIFRERSPFSQTAQSLEANIVTVLYDFLSRIPIGHALDRVDYFSEVFRKMSQTFETHMKLYEDTQGFGIQLLHKKNKNVRRKQDNTMYFIFKKGKLYRTNSNVGIAKRMNLYYNIAQ